MTQCIEENPAMKQTVMSLTHEQWDELYEDLMPDDYWPDVIPNLLRAIALSLASTDSQAEQPADVSQDADVPTPPLTKS